jgi:hypothetical protein
MERVTPSNPLLFWFFVCFSSFTSNTQNISFIPSEVTALGRETITANCKYHPNVSLPPLSLDLLSDNKTVIPNIDVILAINVFHVVARRAIERFASICSQSGAKVVCVYGAFTRDGGRFTTLSNEAFHKTISTANPEFGLRDVETEMDHAMAKHNFKLDSLVDMPSNNFMIVWRKL